MQEQISRQEQLNWIVRNLADKELTIYEMVYCEAGIIKFSEDPSHNPNIHSFTLGEVEQRKAELQNRPKISSLPEWVVFIAQDGDGNWCGYKTKPVEVDEDNCFGSYDYAATVFSSGEVIGDWRDTLEEIKRESKVEGLSVKVMSKISEGQYMTLSELKAKRETDKATKDKQIIEEFKRMVKEDPEWKQAADVYSALKEKQEDWNGEGVPPVGCIVQTSVGQCVVLAVDENRKEAAVQWLNDGALGVINLDAIKPIKSERDRWIDDLVYEFVSYYGNPKGAEKYIGISEAIYDAIVSGKIPLPKLVNK